MRQSGLKAALRRLALLSCLPLLLAACAGEAVWAPQEEVTRAAYRHAGPPSVTLFTVINNRSEEGAHSGLMVNGSQRAMFDPAGSFNHPQLPERNDVIFGITPAARDFYIDYHARETFRVVAQEVPVSAQSAELALRLIQEAGPVGPARCNIAVVEVLRQLPEFEDVPSSWFPKNTMAYFASRPDVTSATYTDDSPDQRGDLVRVPRVR